MFNFQRGLISFEQSPCVSVRMQYQYISHPRRCNCLSPLCPSHPTASLSFPPSEHIPPPKHTFSTREMADQAGTTRFQELFESALQAFERKTGITLSQHPLAVRLQSCHSVDDITSLLQGQAQAFSDFRESDRVMKSIKTTVLILTPLSDAASLAGAFGLVRRMALMACSTL